MHRVTHKCVTVHVCNHLLMQVEEEPIQVRHVTVTITIPNFGIQEEKSPEVQPLSQSASDELSPSTFEPLASGKVRPRKVKRMKIAQPTLGCIEEDEDETNVHTQDMEEGYNDLLSDVSSSQAFMLEQKRKTVALLRQTNYAHKSHQQSRQIAMTALAKRKIRRLPPIPTGRPSLRYTNGQSPSKSPYDNRRE